MYVVQSRGRGRTGLGEVQGTARSGSGLCVRTGVVDQGSTAAAVGSDGGDRTGSGLLWTRRHRQWAQTTVAALAVDCYGLGGTAGSGHERVQAAAGFKARTQCRRLCRLGMLGAEGAMNGME